MNNSVHIKPSADGSIINVYKNNPEFGYIQLRSVEKTFEGNWIRKKERNCLIRAEVELLEEFLQEEGKTGTLPGRIVVNEFTESQLPENYQSRLDKNKDWEEAIEPFLKRAGKDGILLTNGGERILRFTDYDRSGKSQDTTVAHDNVSAIQEARAAAGITAGATLPA
jgi:hypothetical protein